MNSSLNRSSLLLIMVLPSITLLAQKEKYIRYDLLIDKAHTLAAQNRDSAALAYYDSAFALIKWNGSDYLDAAVTALDAEKDDRANDFLIRGAENGLDPWIFNIPVLKAFFATERCQPFANMWGFMDRRFKEHADTAAIHEIESIIALRRNNTEVEIPSTNIDSICFDRIIQLTRLTGSLSAMRIGPSINTVKFLLEQNASTYPEGPQWNEILPFIRSSIAGGRLPPAFLCSIEDLYCLRLGKPMIYGTLVGSWMYTHPVDEADRKKMNRNRASVGLGPLEDFAVQHDLDPNTLLPN
jgi:hypothetical protein